MGANLRQYHFDLGNSTDGPVGVTVRINAFDKQSAVERLQALLPEHIDLSSLLGDGRADGEHITLHLNPEMVHTRDIYEHHFV